MWRWAELKNKYKIYIFILCFIFIAKLFTVPTFTLKFASTTDTTSIIHTLSNDSCILAIKSPQNPNILKFPTSKICIFIILISIIIVCKIHHDYYENIVIDVRNKLFRLISKYFNGSNYKHIITLT